MAAIPEMLDFSQGLMAVAWGVSDLFWLFFILVALQPVLRQKLLEASRRRLLGFIEQHRSSRVILLVRASVQRLLGRHMPAEKAAELADLLTAGKWTHDYPITYQEAKEMGLPVSANMPESVLKLLQLYPQPVRRHPTVEYLPLPRRSAGDRHVH